MERRLTAILVADMVGYSRLMAADEAGTLARQKAHRKELIDPKIAEYGGRLVKSTGDGVLVEFPSVVDALCCAVTIQLAMREREAASPEETRIAYRIGINLGDIIIEDDDIYGDGVNVAARLEALAEPGGVCVSRTVVDHVRGKVASDFEDRGEQQVKNIPEPVHVFGVLMQPEAAGEAVAQTLRMAWWRRPAMGAAAAVLAIAIIGILVWRPWAPDVEPASIERMAFALPDKPSIAVLPFVNMSGDAEQEYFADGMTDDLITDLSKISGLFVIARNSTFTYKGKMVAIRQVAEELGVRYVLEGSVRRAGDQVRINAQLIDAITGGHLWAERYDGSLADVFALQDRVTQKIVNALAVNLTAEEQAHKARLETDNHEAYDVFLRGWAHYRRNTPDDFAKAVPYFEAAIERDSNYGRAYAALAAVYWSVVDKDRSTGTTAWSRALGINTDESRRREQLYLQAAKKNPTPLAYQVASGRLSRQGQHEGAITEAKRAIALDPNDPVAYEAMATALIYAGRTTEAVDQIKQAMRLDPRFPHEYLYWLGLAQFGMERFEDAAETLTRATQSNPDDDRALIVLAAAYGHLEKVQEAKSAIEKADTLRHERQQRLTDPSVEVGVDVLLAGPYTLKDVDLWRFGEGADRARLHEGLRLAGVPKAGLGKAVSPTKVAGATTVDAVEAKSLLDRGVPFVDVRGDDSWNDGHIPGAVHLYLKAGFNEAGLSAVVAKDQAVVVYCQGPRCLLSSKACTKAVAWGFAKVHYFREGFPSWKAAGYPIEVSQ